MNTLRQHRVDLQTYLNTAKEQNLWNEAAMKNVQGRIDWLSGEAQKLESERYFQLEEHNKALKAYMAAGGQF